MNFELRKAVCFYRLLFAVRGYLYAGEMRDTDTLCGRKIDFIKGVVYTYLGENEWMCLTSVYRGSMNLPERQFPWPLALLIDSKNQRKEWTKKKAEIHRK